MLAALGASCGGAPARAPLSAQPGSALSVAPVVPAAPVELVLSVIGTNDVHGAVVPNGPRGGLAVFGGYLANLRAARTGDGGGVLLVDAGDLFQGTLESNLGEGAAMIAAYNLLGYDALAIGNHEFDFGPVGARATATSGDDSRGALYARMAEANFPFLAANIVDRATGRVVTWPKVRSSVLIDRAGVRIGVVGVTTESTKRVTMASSVGDLDIAPLAETIAREAAALRAAGAEVVVAAAHAGGACSAFEDPKELASCDADDEIMAVAAALPAGAVDVLIAGHTHAGMAHLVNGVPVIESYAGGRAFGRVDLRLRRDGAGAGGALRVVATDVHPPREICAAVVTGTTTCDPRNEGTREPASYEGAAILPDERVAQALAPHVERARATKEELLGVTLAERLESSYTAESAVGNLFTELMLAARPKADVALTNGGGLRAPLPAGALSYGALYETSPFDNRFAMVRMTAAGLAALIASNLEDDHGILSIAGVRARATCKGGALIVTLERKGKPLAGATRLLVATSDFLATGGDATAFSPSDVTIEDGPPIREELARVLRSRGGRIARADVIDTKQPRLTFPAPRPVRCPK